MKTQQFYFKKKLLVSYNFYELTINKKHGIIIELQELCKGPAKHFVLLIRLSYA